VDYLIFVSIMINIYIVLAVSLNLIMGYAGLISVCHSAFMGVGAYVSAILMVRYGWNFFWTLPVVLLAAIVISSFFASYSYRVKGDHYIVVSFGIQFIVMSIMLNLAVTNGPNGLAGIGRPEFFGLRFQSNYHFFCLSLGFMLLCIWFSSRLGNSPFGLILKAVREDDVASEALGKNVVYYKVMVFIIGCSLAALAGSFFASIVSFIDPFTFSLEESIFITCLVLIGGSGRIAGSVVGAVLLIVAPELLRFLDVPSTMAGPLRQIFYGLMIIFFMRFRPQGLVAER